MPKAFHVFPHKYTAGWNARTHVVNERFSSAKCWLPVNYYAWKNSTEEVFYRGLTKIYKEALLCGKISSKGRNIIYRNYVLGLPREKQKMGLFESLDTKLRVLCLTQFCKNSKLFRLPNKSQEATRLLAHHHGLITTGVDVLLIIFENFESNPVILDPVIPNEGFWRNWLPENWNRFQSPGTKHKTSPTSQRKLQLNKHNCVLCRELYTWTKTESVCLGYEMKVHKKHIQFMVVVVFLNIFLWYIIYFLWFDDNFSSNF